MEEGPIGADEFRSRLAALCSGGVGPGLPRRRRDAQIFLRGVAACLDPGVLYDERSVGDALRRWIALAGPRVDLDHVTLRRYLVDEGYLVRDPGGSSYEVRRSGRGRVTFDPAVNGLEPARLVADLRQREARRREGPGASGADAAGVAAALAIALASDHAGYAYKRAFTEALSARGHDTRDYGTFSEEPVDYPAFIRLAAQAVARGECDRAILVGGSGNGEAIVANRIPGVRCTLCWNEESARLARSHNDANVLALGARLVSLEEALRIVAIWLETPFEGGRHARRIAQIDAPRGPSA